MIEADDRLLAARFAALASHPDDSDWADVHRRAGRPRRVRTLGLVAATVVAIAIAAPALGLHRTVIDWLEAEPAPEKVRLSFARLAIGAPPGMDPGVIPNSARRVTEVRHDGKVYVLWVAPTRHGGFCFTWTNLFGGCAKDRTPPPGSARFQSDVNPLLLGPTWSPDERGVMQHIGGRVMTPDAERLVAKYADGSEAEIPVVWVSPPIDAGFYLYWIPAEQRRVGHHMTALEAEDRDGEVIARQTFRLTRLEDIERPVRLPDGELAHVPARALVDQARRLIDFRAENGHRVTLWVIPTRDGGRCYVFNRGAGCPPAKYEQKTPMASGLASGARPVLFQGQVRDDVAVVELRFQDGTVERLRPVEGFVLHEIRSAHYAPGHRLELALALGPEDDVLQRHPFRTDAPGVYPCDEPVDQGHGVKMCP